MGTVTNDMQGRPLLAGLGDSLEEIKKTLLLAQSRNISLPFPQELFFAPPQQDIQRLITAVVCEAAAIEQSHLRQLQKKGRDNARRQGVRLGRPPKKLRHFDRVYGQWQDGAISSREAAKRLGIAQSTFLRRAAGYESAPPEK